MKRKKIMKHLISKLALLTLLSPAIGQAYALRACDESGVGPDSFVIPVKQNSRTYGKHAIEVYNIDTEEPAAASAGLAVILPDSSAAKGVLKCFALTGLRAIDIMNAASSYDSALGLLLTIPAVENVDGIDTRKLVLKIRINQKTATVLLESARPVHKPSSGAGRKPDCFVSGTFEK
jgi:hypothetical protein